jgi:hypothetical protein
MSKAITFEGKLLNDGHLLIPEEIKRKLKLKNGSIVNGIIKSVFKEENHIEKLLRLSGSWKDSRSANEIIADIYSNRKSSGRLNKGL